MKKGLALGILATTLLAGLTLQSTAASAGTAEQETKGTVDFGVSTDRPNTIKPGTNDPIIPEEGDKGTATTENVWLLYAPSFKFGTKTINTSKDTEYAAKNIVYKKPNNTTDNFELPQLLQVADQSGIKGTKWAVSAYQTAPFVTGSGSDTSSLTNTRIRLYGKSTTNNVRTATSDMLTTFAFESGKSYTTLGVGATDSIEMLKSQASTADDKTTNGTVSSLVFKNNYSEADYGQTASADTDGNSVDKRTDNSDVKLFVPYKDTPQKASYTATIKWTLTSAP